MRDCDSEKRGGSPNYPDILRTSFKYDPLSSVVSLLSFPDKRVGEEVQSGFVG